MINEERISLLPEEKYQELFGVKKGIFDEMLKILEDAHHQEHLRGGRPLKLSVLDKLIIMLGYYREYRSMGNIAFDYGVSKSTICESIKWAENILIKSERFHLPSKSELAECTDIEVVVVDATECEIERPQKNKESTIPGRKRSIR